MPFPMFGVHGQLLKGFGDRFLPTRQPEPDANRLLESALTFQMRSQLQEGSSFNARGKSRAQSPAAGLDASVAFPGPLQNAAEAEQVQTFSQGLLPNASVISTVRAAKSSLRVEKSAEAMSPIRALP